VTADLSVRGPFEARLAAASWAGATLRGGEPRSQIGLRARGPAVSRLAVRLEAPSLPAVNRVRETPLGDLFGLGPDEFLLVGALSSRATSLRTLEEALGREDGAAVDLSSARQVLELSGESARDVLASCCPLDLHASVFAPGHCAQTVLAKAPILITLRSGNGPFELYVRPSLAAYVVSWLVDGMEGVRAEAV